MWCTVYSVLYTFEIKVAVLLLEWDTDSYRHTVRSCLLYFYWGKGKIKLWTSPVLQYAMEQKVIYWNEMQDEQEEIMGMIMNGVGDFDQLQKYMGY